MHKGTVKRRLKDWDGNPVGKRSTNHVLDSRQYEVEFQDESIEIYTANMIAENMFAQVDDEGKSVQI